MTRIAACWSNGQHYEIRDTDGRIITADEGRKICADQYRIDTTARAKRRDATATKKLKGAGRDRKESQSAPVTDPPPNHAT